MDENQLKKLAANGIVKPQLSSTARKAYADNKDAGFASASDLGTYLGVSQRRAKNVLECFGIKTNRAGRTRWINVWDILWNIHNVPAQHHELMKRELLNIEQVAGRVGVSPRSILRDGDRSRSLYDLPRHVQLSPRRRRYHPEMILLWEMELPLEDWMRPIKRRHHIGLKRRIDQTNPP